MIQRIQTIYFVLAIVAVVVCMCEPVGIFRANNDMPIATLYNLWASVEMNGNVSHVVMPYAVLFGLLALTATVLTADIFLFSKRALQMRIASFSMIMLVCYYIIAILLILITNHNQGFALLSSFRPTVWAALPLVALILTYLAFRGILKDELLIRSTERLR